jgi:hypothetical protein
MDYKSPHLLFVHSGIAHKAQISSYIETVAKQQGCNSEHYVRVICDKVGSYRNQSFVYLKDVNLAKKLVDQSEPVSLIPDVNQASYIYLMSNKMTTIKLALQFEYAKIPIENPEAYDFHVLRISGLPITKTIEEQEKRVDKLTNLLQQFCSNDNVKVKVKVKIGSDTVYAFYPINLNDGIFARACLQYEKFEDVPLQIHIAHKFKKKEENDTTAIEELGKQKLQVSYRRRYGNSNYFDRDKTCHPCNVESSWRTDLTKLTQILC